MTLINKPVLKVVPLPVTADLGEVALESALAIAMRYPHDGWADLIVHQAELRPAMRVAIAHNDRSPSIKVRVSTDTTLGRADWKVKTRGVIITSFWTNKI